ncbi:hypothetical protein ACIQW9_07195 [Herminiimonas sp. NPDC097707]|uniref:hypothetical protein n=1 Tax=Herminiimonas sp. NPDC097707 TaxID=3364007 RepID=UPI00383B45E4
MAFQDDVRLAVQEYVENHLPDDQFYAKYFGFISDVDLRTRLEEEFRSARYIYKMLEGMQAKDWLLTAQVKVQILLYASIYEAVLHHVLFKNYADSPSVKNLLFYEHRKPINISGDLKSKIQSHHQPSGAIKVYEIELKEMDERKIVFEDKADAALALGLIDLKIRNIVCNVYSLRNAIHLHAELRRGIVYGIAEAREAYHYLQGFCQQVAARLTVDGKVAQQSANQVVT